VRELADRYLTHAVRCPPLRDDPPLLYGLALLYSDRLDPDLLAALWNVEPTDVADVTTRLAARHDFVLHDSRRLHDDIRDTIRLYLLDDALRAQQRPMNRRAVAHLRDRLTQLDLRHVDDQVTSEDWQGLATALLWHTFWEDNRAGIRLLCHLLPAAHVLAERFAAALLSTAEFFLPVLSAQQTQMITELHELRPAAVLLASGRGEMLREAADSRRAQGVLEREQDGDSPGGPARRDRPKTARYVLGGLPARGTAGSSPPARRRPRRRISRTGLRGGDTPRRRSVPAAAL